MKYVRYQDKKNTISFGVLEGKNIKKIDGDLFGSHTITETTLPLSEVRLLAPCLPSKVVCAGTNYMSHIKETNSPTPKVPLIFLKPDTSVIGPDEGIEYPEGIERVDYEGELGVVIGKTCKGVPKEKIMDYILGYTCLNDVSARDMQWGDGQWTRGKSQDTFCPIGPVITDEIDAPRVDVITRLNGEVKQHGNTSDLLFDIPALTAFIAEGITLKPGDVIATGTPSGIAPMKVGDVVEIEIPGIGILKNPVVKK